MTFNQFIARWNKTQEHSITDEREKLHAFVRESTQTDLDWETWCRYYSWFVQTEDVLDEKQTQAAIEERWTFERQMGLAY
jgi:hypothetical protein